MNTIKRKLAERGQTLTQIQTLLMNTIKRKLAERGQTLTQIQTLLLKSVNLKAKKYNHCQYNTIQTARVTLKTN